MTQSLEHNFQREETTKTMKSPTSYLVFLMSVVTCEIRCGVFCGYDKGEKAYFFSGDGSLANFDACSDRCQADVKCLSFAFGNTQCLLYSSPLDGNFRHQSNSPFLFNDRDCAKARATSSFASVLPQATPVGKPPGPVNPPVVGGTTPKHPPGSPSPHHPPSSDRGGSGGGENAPPSHPAAPSVSTPTDSRPGGQFGVNTSGFSTVAASGAVSAPTGPPSPGRGSGSGNGTIPGSVTGSGSTVATASAGQGAVALFRMLALDVICVLAWYL